MNPSDPAAERAVLAGVCQHGADVYHDVCDIVTPRTFSIDSNQLIWSCVDHLFKNGDQSHIDYPSILSAAKDLGFLSTLEKSDERAHLRAVLNMPVRQESVRRMAGRVRKLEVARLFRKQHDQAKERLGLVTGEESIDEIVAMAEEPIFDLSSLLNCQEESGPVLMGTSAKEYAIHLMDNPREMIGISTGYPRYDRAIGGGVRPNSLDIIAGRAKSGKSGVADEVGVNVASQMVPVFSIDTEMVWEERLHRILAKLSGVSVRDIETGKAGVKSLSRRQVSDAAEKLASLPYYYQSVIGMSFEDILASMRRWVTKTVGIGPNGKANSCVFIYDYLKLLSADGLGGNMAEYQMLGFITTALKNFMGRYGAGCVCFAQLNRDGIELENEAAIAGSDRIVHYATSISIFKKRSVDEIADSPEESMGYTHKLIPIVSRHGEGMSDGDHIFMKADFAHARITEGPTRSELARGLVTQGRNSGEIVVDDTVEASF